MQAVWAVKGGVGTSVVAAGLALGAAAPVLLVDLAGDQPALFGVHLEADAPGVAPWTRAGDEVPPDALGRIEVEAAPGVALIPRGDGAMASARLGVLAALLRQDHRTVVVDCGTLTPGDPRLALATGARRSILVTRACPVAQARLTQLPTRPSGVVVVRDMGRALRWPEVAAAVVAPVVAELDVDPAVGAAVDAGLGARALPRTFLRALRAAS